MLTTKTLKTAEACQYELLREIRDGRITNETEYRPIVAASNKSIILRMENGRTVEQKLPKASLLRVCSDTIVIYDAGYRPLTNTEKVFIKSWLSKQSKLKDTNCNIRVIKQDYFRAAGYEYLLGTKKVKGKIYDWKSNMVQDDSILGETKFLYRIRPR